jgi:hypothetical protein
MIANQPLKLRSKIAEGPEGTKITVPRSKRSALLLALIGGSMAYAGIFLLRAAFNGTEAPNATLLIGGLGLFSLAIGILAISLGFGRTVLTFQPNCLVVRKESFGIGRTRFLNANELSDSRFWCVARHEDDQAYTTPAIVLVHRGKTIFFGVGELYRDEAEYLVSLIKNRYPKINVIPPESAKHNWKE